MFSDWLKCDVLVEVYVSAQTIDRAKLPVLIMHYR